MSKAVLVVDMPNTCWKCSLIVEKENGSKMCPITGCTLISRDGKFSWCPLKEMPDKVEVFMDDWADGYNACIDDIVGE